MSTHIVPCIDDAWYNYYVHVLFEVCKHYNIVLQINSNSVVENIV